jgi:hypothetical protein
LYLTDANGYFGLAIDLIRSMQMSRHLPPLMVAGMARMTGRPQQRRYPALNLSSETFPGEFHITVPPLALSRGLRYAFDAPH